MISFKRFLNKWVTRIGDFCMQYIGDYCIQFNLIGFYKTISIIILAIFTNNISHVNIDFEQNLDIQVIIKNVFLLVSAVLFQKFGLHLESAYDIANKEFYGSSKKDRAKKNIEKIYIDHIENPKNKFALLICSFLFFLFYLFAIPLYTLICS